MFFKKCAKITSDKKVVDSLKKKFNFISICFQNIVKLN